MAEYTKCDECDVSDEEDSTIEYVDELDMDLCESCRDEYTCDVCGELMQSSLEDACEDCSEELEEDYTKAVIMAAMNAVPQPSPQPSKPKLQLVHSRK